MTKKHRVSKEVKEQILKRIKEEGVSGLQLAGGKDVDPRMFMPNAYRDLPEIR